MRKKEHTIELDKATRHRLEQMQQRGIWLARELKHARIILLSDSSDSRIVPSNAEIAHIVGCHSNTVMRIRKRFVQDGLEAALKDQPRPGQKRFLDTLAEQKLSALACTKPPDGQAHWTCALLAQELMSLKIVKTISDESVRRALLRHDLKPWRKKNVGHSGNNA